MISFDERRRAELIASKDSDEALKLIYEWVKKREISLREFKSLVLPKI